MTVYKAANSEPIVEIDGIAKRQANNEIGACNVEDQFAILPWQITGTGHAWASDAFYMCGKQTVLHWSVTNVSSACCCGKAMVRL